MGTDVGNGAGTEVGDAAAAAKERSASVGVEVGVARSPTAKGCSCSEQANPKATNNARVIASARELRLTRRYTMMTPSRSADMVCGTVKCLQYHQSVCFG